MGFCAFPAKAEKFEDHYTIVGDRIGQGVRLFLSSFVLLVSSGAFPSVFLCRSIFNRLSVRQEWNA